MIRQVIIAHLMTLQLLGGEVLRLGQDVSTPFPQALEQVLNSKLRDLLVQTDTTPDSLSESGALDWADFKERMLSLRISSALTRNDSFCLRRLLRSSKWRY